jgi:hypothetical protein
VASKSLVEWLKMLWENWRMSTWCVMARMLLSPFPRGWGFAPPFIDQGGGGIHARRAI